jgi:hypothetical protein
MSEREFDLYEKADAYLESRERREVLDCDCRMTGDIADASDCDLHGDAADWHREPITCPVLAGVYDTARTVGELLDACKFHRLEYCEECGQLEGFVRPDRRKAA